MRLLYPYECEKKGIPHNLIYCDEDDPRFHLQLEQEKIRRARERENLYNFKSEMYSPPNPNGIKSEIFSGHDLFPRAAPFYNPRHDPERAEYWSHEDGYASATFVQSSELYSNGAVRNGEVNGDIKSGGDREQHRMLNYHQPKRSRSAEVRSSFSFMLSYF